MEDKQYGKSEYCGKCGGNLVSDDCTCKSDGDIETLRSQLNRCKEYMEHKRDCNKWYINNLYGTSEIIKEKKCTCGLDDLLKEIE